MNSKDFLKEGFIEDAYDVHVDHEVQMAREECYHAAENALALHKLLRNISEQQGLEGWVSAKITLANEYLNTVREHLEYELLNPQGEQNIKLELPVAESATGDTPIDKMSDKELANYLGGTATSNWVANHREQAEEAAREKSKKMVAEGLNEMDKSAPQPGRDGKVSFSTYGSRDKKGDDYFKGKELPTKPITVKKMEKDALGILKKQGLAEGSKNLNYIGNCTDDDVIEHIFGDATNFAQAVEEHGDEFTIGDLVVKYDPETDVHSFYYKKQGVAEAGPFSYGNTPRKGSVADLAAKKRREQEKGKQPIEPKDQQVGVAKVTKGVAEGGMPTLVIKHKQKIANMSDEEFANSDHYKKFNDDQLRAMAWRHGYGKNSNHYVEKRLRGQKISSGERIKESKKKESNLVVQINEPLAENLRNWFKEKWVRFGPDGKIRGDCARGDESEGKPKCLPQAKAHALGKKGRKTAASRKRREDPNPERSGPAINVKTKESLAVIEGTESQYIAARYIDEFADGDHWYVKGAPDVIKKFVLLANSLEDEAVKDTEYEPDKGMMAKVHAQLGDDSVPQWTVVQSQNLEQLKPIGNRVLQLLMKPDLSYGAQEFMSELLWTLEEKGLALVTSEPQQGVAEAAKPGTKKPEFSGWLAMTYQRENAGKKFPSNVRSKSGLDLNKIIPQDEFDIDDIEIDDDSISMELSPLLYDNFRLSSTGGGAGQGFSEHFYQLPNVRGFNMALELGKRLLAGEAAIKRWFESHNQSLRKIGLPEYKVQCWGGITSPVWRNDDTSDVIADLDGLRAIYNRQAQLGDFWNKGTIGESIEQGVAEGDFDKWGGEIKTPPTNWKKNLKQPTSPAKLAKQQAANRQRKQQRIAEDSESAIQKIEKKIQAKRDALGLARERRRMKGNRQQGQQEIKIQAEIDNLSDELRQLKNQSIAEDQEDTLYDKITTKYPKTKLALDLFPHTAVATSLSDTVNSLSKQAYGDAALNALGLIPGLKPIAKLTGLKDIAKIEPYYNAAKIADKSKDLSDYAKADLDPRSSNDSDEDYSKISTDMMGTPISSMQENLRFCPECKGPLVEFSQLSEKKDACYYKVKNRYKVWPSAYASGALVKCRKKGAKNWGNKSESVSETAGATPAGAVATINTASSKPKSQVGTLFGGTYKQKKTKK